MLKNFSADHSYTNILYNVMENGEKRETRSGEVISMFDAPNFLFQMEAGAPLLTGKKIFTQQMIGELLWFIGGDHSLHQLAERTWGKDEVQSCNGDLRNTIWTGDQQRWYNALSPETQRLLKYPDDLGRTYGRQWRNSAGKFGVQVDQIVKLIAGLKSNPYGRYHIVNSWNAAEIDADMMALAPCHTMFQCYVSNDNKLSLKWYQRSVDCFLGLPFNIASYGLLLSLLCKLTGYKEGELIGTFGDCHVYSNHVDAVRRYLANPVFDAPKLVLPYIESLEALEKMTALDFKGCYKGYENSGVISAPLSVG
ncbi:thymidylate synthase [Yersinia phage vB_YenM_P778]